VATSTAGTNTTTRLPFFVQWQRGGLLAADLAAIRSRILNDRPQMGPGNIWPGALENGQLFVPNRGYLQLIPGDWVGVGTVGWPFLISAAEMTADWTHTP
jgi:hypothetical protein